MKQIVLSRGVSFSLIALLFLNLLAFLNMLTPLVAISKYSLVLFTFIIFFKLLTMNQVLIPRLKLLIAFAAFELIYIVWLISDNDGFFDVFYQGFFFVMVYFLCSITWKHNQIRLLTLGAVIIYMALVIYFYIGAETINPNTIGAYVYFLLFFPVLYLAGFKEGSNKPLLILTVLASMIIIYISGARSIFLAVAFSFFTALIWKFLTKNKFLFYGYFLALLGLITSFTYYIYPNIRQVVPNFQHYEYLSIKYTGKSLISGRDEIWSQIIMLIQNQPLLGYGPGFALEDVINIPTSAHNLYLEIALQTGFIGFLVFMLILFMIWKTLWLKRNDIKVAITAMFFVGIVIHQVFEVSLTQNNFSLGLLQWMIIGIGLSFCMTIPRSKKTL